MDLSTIICDLEEADTASFRVKIEQSGCIDIVITACKRFFIGPDNLAAPFFPSFAF